MSTYTPYLDLLKKNPLTEGSDTFNITTMLNDNWDKIDSGLATRAIRPNLLDNWYFVGGGSQRGGGRFPINQRGATSYSGAVYGIDRWKGSANIGVDILTTGLKVTATAGSTQVVQIIENSDDLKGMKVTLSALTSSGSLLKNTVTLPDSIPTSNTTIGTGTEVVNGYNLYVRAQSGKFYVSIFASSQYTSAGLTLVAVKLELGSTQTLAHQENGTWVLNEVPNFEVELAKCQRYDYLNSNGMSQFIRAAYIAANAIYFDFPVPVPMRAGVVYTVLSSGKIGVFNMAGAAQTGFAFTVQNGYGGTLRITATKTSHGLTDAYLDAANILFSSDL